MDDDAFLMLTLWILVGGPLRHKVVLDAPSTKVWQIPKYCNKIDIRLVTVM